MVLTNYPIGVKMIRRWEMATKITKINQDTFMLTDKLIRVNQFLLCGEKRALLIDTGYGGEKFLRAVKKVTALPVSAA